jgi:hypothetical protein
VVRRESWKYAEELLYYHVITRVLLVALNSNSFITMHGINNFVMEADIVFSDAQN